MHHDLGQLEESGSVCLAYDTERVGDSSQEVGQPARPAGAKAEGERSEPEVVEVGTERPEGARWGGGNGWTATAAPGRGGRSRAAVRGDASASVVEPRDGRPVRSLPDPALCEKYSRDTWERVGERLTPDSGGSR